MLKNEGEGETDMIFLKKPTKWRVFFSHYLGDHYVPPPIPAHLFYLCNERMFPPLRATAVRFDHSRHPLDSRARMRLRQNAYNSGFPGDVIDVDIVTLLTSLGKNWDGDGDVLDGDEERREAKRP
jgi:hypothetical protein